MTGNSTRDWTRKALLLVSILGSAHFPDLASHSFAQDEDEGQADMVEETIAPGFAPETRAPELSEYTKDTTRIDGLFPVYVYPRTGKVLLEVREDQIGKDFLYFAMTVDGIISAGHFRGAHRAAEIIRLRRQYDRIEFIAQNTRFHLDPNSPLARAANANVSQATLASAPIVAASTDGKRLILDVTSVFLAEALHQIKPSTDPYEIKGRRFELGALSSNKTRYRDIRNYPSNTDIQVAYTYDNPRPLNYGDEEVTDSRAVTITMQHSFIALDNSDYEPRFDDWRVGYFTNRVTDLTSTSFTPYRDLINRWNLKKMDPDAALSPPVKPIVLWIENTTPTEFRSIIADAVLSWNAAFEAAGFRNAIEVKIQPDDASWDAGDIRYNVIRWMSSPDPAFGGIGPRLTNPRTGEILAADIMLEYAFIQNRIKRQRLMGESAFDVMSLVDLQSDLDDSNAAWVHDDDGCDLGEYLQSQMMLGQIALAAAAAPVKEVDRLVEEGLRKLVVHEVGHVLGLQHNMKSSTILPLAELHADTVTDERGLIGSIMDYPAVNLAPPGTRQGSFYMTRPGPYDIWAIQAGYTPSLEDPEAEAARREAILSRSTEPQLAFGNDADDMRRPGRGIDPRVMIGDLSADPLGWSAERLGWVKYAMGTLDEKFIVEGESFQPLRSAFYILTGEAGNAAIVASRQIGGVMVERANIGQAGAGQPFTPIPESRQREAMALLAREVFAPDAFTVPESLARRLQIQRRGYDFRNVTEDPKFHGRALSIQVAVLAHLMHRRTLERLTDSSIYGNTYSAYEMLSDLTDAIFAADAKTDVNTYRQNLQTAYVLKLIRILKPAKPKQKNKRPIIYDPVSRGAAMAQLRRIEKIAEEPLFNLSGVSEETLAHRAYLRQLISEPLSDEVE